MEMEERKKRVGDLLRELDLLGNKLLDVVDWMSENESKELMEKMEKWMEKFKRNVWGE
jgi:hypothetical protein